MRDAARMLICIAMASAAASCGGGREQQACRMEREAVLASISDAPNTLTMSRISSGALVVAWSSGWKTWFVKMNEEGVRTGEARMLERYSVPSRMPDAVVDGGVKTFWPAVEGTSFAQSTWIPADLEREGSRWGSWSAPAAEGRGEPMWR